MNKQIILTISLLISNRPDTVRKCLDSLKPLLDNIPSELILVNTGCGEEVRGIIEEYKAQIIDFEWCRDFSKARNAGLERAKGEWFLYLDDDEWFEDVSEIVRFFQSGEYRAYGVGLYTQRNYMLLDGSEYTELLVARMIRLEPDIKFIYKVHECFSRAPGRARKLNAYVHHYGYIYKDKEEHHAHAMRNISLLLEERKEHPLNMRHALQLAQEYNSIGEREKSLELSREAIDCAERGAVESEYCLSSLYANEINAYVNLKRYDEAIEKGELYLKSRRTDKLVKALIAGRLTSAYMAKEDYGKCLEHAHRYWDTYQDYLKNEESFMGFISPITDISFHERMRAVFLGNGIRAAVQSGQAALAWEWFQGIGWDGNKDYIEESMVRDIVGRMPEAEEKEREYYNKMCDILLSHEELKGFVIHTIMKRCAYCEGEAPHSGHDSEGRNSVERDQENRDSRSRNLLEDERQARPDGEWNRRIRTAAAYLDLQPVHWFLKLIGLTTAAFLPETGIACSGREAEEMAAEVWSVMEESMPQMRAYNMPEAVKRLGGDNGHVVESIPFLDWEKRIARYFSCFSWKETAWWAERLADMLHPDSMHLFVWRAACGISRASGAAAELEKKADSGDGKKGLPEKEEKAMAEITDGLREYAVCRVTLCESIYQPQIIQDMPDILPEEYRGAYAIWNLLEMTEAERYGDAVNAVREIKELLPGLANIMKHYLKWLNGRMERQKQESRQAVSEFQILARQIKAKIYGLMEAGEYGAALSVAEQIEAMLPGDAEIQQIKEKIRRKL